MTEPHSCDVLVTGGGLAGLTCAYALAEGGKNVILCCPAPSGKDTRTTALLNNSVEFLNKLGLWDDLKTKAHPLKIMRLVDGSRRLFRFPQSDFNASEIGADAFGYNIRNQDLLEALGTKLSGDDRVTIVDGTLDALDFDDDSGIAARLKTSKHNPTKIETGFIVGADGRNSFVRQRMGHGERSWDYGQTALVVDFEHQYSSNFASTEFQTEHGPFTIVPHDHTSAGLVWLQTPEQAQEHLHLKPAQLNLRIEEMMQSFLGIVKITNKPTTFPMTGMIANRFGDDRHALIGEAAHVFPPIGAQGFNLGIRDIEGVIEALDPAINAKNPGNFYHNRRKADISSRTFGVDLLNRSLLTDFIPVQMLRSAGIIALNKVAPLRKQAMKMGISPIM